MKKFLCILIILSFVLPSPVCAFASNSFNKSNTNYELPEVGIEIPIPSSYYVLTQNVQENDPALSCFGFSIEEWRSFASGNGIYLDALDPYSYREIVVTLVEDSMLLDLNSLPNTAIDMLMDTFTDMYADAGITLYDYEVYQHSQAKFLKLFLSRPNGDSTIYSIQYSTLYNDRCVNITLHSFNGKTTTEDETFIKNIIDDTLFIGDPVYTEQSNYSAGVFYQDNESDVSFNLPENWEQIALSKDREILDAKFESVDDEAVIMYGSIDVYELLGSEKSGAKRADVDILNFTQDEIHELFDEAYGTANNTEQGLERLIINGTTFYKGITHHTQDFISFDMTAVFTIKNGYFYLFEYMGGRENVHYDDFEYALESVKFESAYSYSYIGTLDSLNLVPYLGERVDVVLDGLEEGVHYENKLENIGNLYFDSFGSRYGGRIFDKRWNGKFCVIK